MYTTILFLWKKSPACCHSLSEAKATYTGVHAVLPPSPTSMMRGSGASPPRSGVPTKNNGCPPQRLTDMLVSYFCSFFLSDPKYDLRLSRIQPYLGSLCNSSTTSFWILENKLQTLHVLIHAVVEHGSFNMQMLEKIASKCDNMSVAGIPPASMWTHDMLAAIANANGRAIQLSSKTDLRAELNTWCGLSATAGTGQWCKPGHCPHKLTSPPSTRRQVSGVKLRRSQGAPSPRVGGFLTVCHLGASTKNIWVALLEELTECGRAHPGQLRPAQVVLYVDNRFVVDT